MTVHIGVLFALLSCFALGTELKVCIDQELKHSDIKVHFEDQLTKEVLFKNVYETLFYYDKTLSKISANVAQKLEKVSENKFQLVLKDKVEFHNNKIFFVKKFVDYKDVIFSLNLVKDSKIKVSYEKKKIYITSELNLLDTYKLLSEPQYVIYSRAYYNYLKKKKKLNLFYERPIGTGPFKLSKIKAPYELTEHKKYHLKNRLTGLNYVVSKDYLKSSCDVFWNYDHFKVKEYTVKKGYKVEKSKANNLMVLINHTKQKQISKLFDPYKIKQDVFKSFELELTSTVIPSFVKESYILNPKEKEKITEEISLNIHIDKSMFEIISFGELSEYIEKQTRSKFVKLNFLKSKTKQTDITISFIKDINSLEDLNKKLLCAYDSPKCNQIKNADQLYRDLIKDNMFISFGYVVQNLFYKKDIINLKPDFNHSIDYSEVIYFNN